MFRLSPASKQLSLAFGLLSPCLAIAAEQATQLEQMVVTATKTQQSIKEVPASVSVITREQIEQSTATTVDQLLQGMPGVYAARMDASSPNRIAQTYTRGLPGNSRTLVLLDGVPMNVLYDGQVDWSQLSTQDIERVEVVRGASSGLYGSNAMGGVINILTRAPAEGTHSRVGIDYGSMNSKRLSASHSQSHGATSFSLSASRFESDGYDMWRPGTTPPAANRLPIGTVKDNFSAKLIQEINADNLLEASISYMRDEATGFYGPGTAGYEPQTREQYVPSLKYTNTSGDTNTTAVAYARIGKQWADTLNSTAAQLPGVPLYAGIVEKGYYEDKTFGLNAQHSRPLSKTQTLTFGADLISGEIDNSFTYPVQTPGRLRTTKGEVTRYGFFVQDEIKLTSRWNANAAARFDHWKLGGNATETNSPPNPATTAFKETTGQGFTPKLSTLYKLTDQLNVRASAGKAFNIPDMFNLYANTIRGTVTYWANPDLKAEKVTSYDFGLDYYFGNASYVKATAYRNEASDFIYSVVRNATNQDKINVGGVVTQGLELEASYRPLPSLALTGSYTLNTSKIVKNESNPALVGKQLTNVPRNRGYLRADWTITPGSQVFAAMTHVGNRFGDDTNTVANTYKQYTIYDLGGSYALTRDISARLTLANVTNKKYEGIGYIAPGATVTAGLNIKF